MRPVGAEFPVSQPFGGDATGGVAANSDPNSGVGYLVYLYGNYQPYGHAGQDIGCPVGTPVHAIADGTVLWADWGTNLPGDESWSASGYFLRWALYKTFPGIVTVIQHDGWISVYAHLSDAPLNPGDRVTEGQQIALSGNTRAPGVSLAAHLHVEALVDLTYSTGNGLIYGRTDPTPYFGGITAQSGTVTPLEADMPLTPAEKQEIIDGVLYAKIPKYNAQNVQVGTTTLAESAAWQEANFKTGRDTVTGLLGTRLPAPDGSGHSYTLAEYITYGWLYGMNNGARTLGQTIKLADGTVATLASLLAATYTKPAAAAVTAAPPQLDVEVLVARLKAELPPEFLAQLATKLTK